MRSQGDLSLQQRWDMAAREPALRMERTIIHVKLKLELKLSSALINRQVKVAGALRFQMLSLRF